MVAWHSHYEGFFVFIEVDNSPRDYAWGSLHAIAELLGRPASGKPEAEVWYGTHPMSPSLIVDPSAASGARDLAKVTTLPFLLKVLAAETALSIQVHPSMDQARVGFAAENSAGIPVDAPHRNYRDESHKPELIYCVSDSFDALCGIRPVVETVAALREFIAEATLSGLPSERLVRLVDELEKSPTDVRLVVAELLGGDRDAAAETVAQLVAVATRVSASSVIERDASTVRMLNAEYPGDAGIVLAFLMNRVSLRRGEAIFVPHGILHAYLHGLGIEIMAASDNVLRGGLTTKHIDVGELMKVGLFAPTHPELFTPEVLSAGVHRFAPGVPEFELIHVSADESGVEIDLDGPVIALCTSGHATLSGSTSDAEIHRGQAWFITSDEGTLRVNGVTELFIARAGGGQS